MRMAHSKLVAVFMLALVLTGCGNSPPKSINYNAYPEVPIAPLKDDAALVYIYGEDMDSMLRINGIDYAEFKAGHYTYFYLPSGKNTIIYYDSLVSSRVLRELVREFEAGHVYHLKSKQTLALTDGGLLIHALRANSAALGTFVDIGERDASYSRKRLIHQDFNNAE